MLRTKTSSPLCLSKEDIELKLYLPQIKYPLLLITPDICVVGFLTIDQLDGNQRYAVGQVILTLMIFKEMLHYIFMLFQAFTQQYSFFGRIKLIILLIRHVYHHSNQ